jgi:hypothetical protein
MKLDTANVSLEVKKPNQSIERNNSIVFLYCNYYCVQQNIQKSTFYDKLKLAGIIWLSWTKTSQTTQHVKNT